MRTKLPWILFAVSLLLNVFFAGGVIYSKMTADRLRHTPEERIDFVAGELGLTAEERQALVALRDAAGQRRAVMREEGQPLREILFEELSKPDLDRARLDELLAARSQLYVSSMADTMMEMHGFLAGLDPEKREAFLSMMQEDRRFLWRLMSEPRDRRKPGG